MSRQAAGYRKRAARLSQQRPQRLTAAKLLRVNQTIRSIARTLEVLRGAVQRLNKYLQVNEVDLLKYLDSESIYRDRPTIVNSKKETLINKQLSLH